MANYRHPESANDFFFPLDNSAVFMAATTVSRSPYVFRLSCELDEPVYVPALEQAVSLVAARFPFVKTRLRSGVFWFYLDPVDQPPAILPDTGYPCASPGRASWKTNLVRVFVRGPVISCEFHHILTDGTGGIEFVRSLIAEYLTLRGVTCANWQDIRRPGEVVDPAELEDAYDGLFRSDVPNPDPLPNAFHEAGGRFDGDEYRVTSASFSVSKTLEVCRARGATITAFFTAVYLDSLQTLAGRSGQGPFKPICVQIPVNMRKIHPSKTMRNFFLFIPVSIDRRLGEYSFDEILQRVQYSLKTGLDMREMQRQIHRNVRGERFLFSRVVPLAIKNAYLRHVGEKVADAQFSGNLSNTQTVTMPVEFAEHIKRFDMIPPRRDTIGASVGMISFKDVLSVIFASRVRVNDLERIFLSKCAAFGLEARVVSNMPAGK